MSAYGIYLHVPWCVRRCPYCAFYVERDVGADWDRFLDALLREHRLRAIEFPGAAATVFLGGGSPSRMPLAHLKRLLDALPRAPGAEVSLEANPEDIDAAWMAGALAAGVNRLSLGVQTLDVQHARTLGRGAGPDRARQVLDAARTAGFRSWSADLIFALPGQTLADLERDLDALLAYEPPHISLYGLTWEPGTPLHSAWQRGRVRPADEDTWAAMYDHLVERLSAAGLARYEVSNFARPGHACAHNQLYWTDTPYLALGPSAHGYAPSGRRWVNRPDAQAYLDAADPTDTSELPSPMQHAEDILVSVLRTPEGLPQGFLAARTGYELDAAVVARLRTLGLLQADPQRVALSHAGFPVADGVIRTLADGLVEPESAA